MLGRCGVAALRRGGVRVGDGVAVEPRFPARSGNRERAEVAAVAVERGEVLQHLHVVDAVVGVDAEAERAHQLDRQVEAGHRGEAGDVLHRCAERVLVTAQQDVGAAVDQHHRVDIQLVDQIPVGLPQRLHAQRRKGVHGGGQIVGGQPPGECALREVPVRAGRVRRHRHHVLRHPRLPVDQSELGERQAGQ